MRIISGIYRGYQFKTYNGSNTRPTTDLAKESLFNALQNILSIEDCSVVDLFAGTGNIGLEFLSRGAKNLTSVDVNYANITFMKDIQKELNVKDWQIKKADAIQYLKNVQKPIDILFADPPYDYVQLHQLSDTVTKSDWFNTNNTLFVLEHSDKMIFHSGYLLLKKQYGSTCFSIFRATQGK